MDIFNLNSKNMNSIAIIDDTRQFTYGQLNELVDRMAANLPQRSLIALLADNTIETVVAYLACLKAGAVILMLNSNIQDDQLFSILHEYMPQMICSCRKFSHTKLLYQCFDMFLQKTQYNQVQLHDSLALLLPTSGSTGSSKFVRISYSNLKANTESISAALTIDKEDCTITTMPICYTYGLSIVNTHLLKGSCIVMNTSSVITQEFWTKLEKFNVTSFGGVPYIYELIDRLNLFPKEPGSLKYLSVAGGKLSDNLTLKMCSYCSNNNMKFFTMYGQTEATARMMILPWERAFDKLGSVGVAISGGKAFLVNNQNEIISEPGILGEIIYQGENVALGYADSYEDLKKGDDLNGILKTGDLAMQDKDGFFYIRGRMKSFVKIHGKRISLLDIEKMLMDEGIEAACIQKDDFIYLFTTSEETSFNTIYSLLYKIEITKRYCNIKIIDKIPRNYAGKILYSDLEKMIQP